jgi:hypothetical protein
VQYTGIARLRTEIEQTILHSSHVLVTSAISAPLESITCFDSRFEIGSESSLSSINDKLLFSSPNRETLLWYFRPLTTQSVCPWSIGRKS